MATPFDLDRRLCEVRPPSVQYGGHTYVGRFVSWEQYLAWAPRMDAIGAHLAASEGELRALAVEMATELFPDPPPRRWFRRGPTVAELVARPQVDSGTLYALLVTFFEALAMTLPHVPEPTPRG